MRVIGLILALTFVTVALFAQQPAENVVAKVNDIEITAEDLQTGNMDKMDMFMEDASGGRRQRNIDPDHAEWMLEETINQTLMYNEAEKSGMAEDPDVLAMVEAYKRAAMVQMYIDKVLYEEVKPTEEEIREEYEQTDRFNQDPHAEVIRVWGRDEEDVRNRFEQMNDMSDEGQQYEHVYYHELERKGNDGNVSADGSTVEGRMNPEYSDKLDMIESVRQAKAGDIVGPMQIGERWVMIEVVRQVPAGKRPFEEVREEIERYMTQERLHRAMEEKVQELRKSSTVTIYYENLNKAFSE